MPTYSVIVPCYNEEAVIEETHKRLTKVMQGMHEPYEIVYVNDGSKDKTAAMLDVLAQADESVRVVHFAHNSGHQIAVSAGLDYATGDAIVIIDADLQDPPELIPDMAALWKQGAKVVYGKRRARAGETAFKKKTAEVYYRLINRLTGGMVPKDTGDFRMVDKQVADVVRAMPEHARFLRGMFAWAGFEQTPLLYDRDKRFAGQTHYPLKKMLRLAADGVFSFSVTPLRLATCLGAFWLGIGILTAFVLLILLICGTTGGAWWLAALMMTLGGSILFCIGILGEYVARMFDDVRARPLYVVERTIGFHKQ